MSKLNINRNTFLEKEELIRFQEFLINSTSAQALLQNSTNWGIVRTVFVGVTPDFLVESGSNVGTIKVTSNSNAVDKDNLLIKLKAFDNLPVPTEGVFYWVKISHKYTNLEEGTCQIDADGSVSGVGTLFSQVLRGQSSEVPVKIIFYKQSGLLNTQVYEVVSLDSTTPDLNLILAGTGFVAESDLKYIVIGSTPVGETVTDSQKDGIYQYDDCNLEFILETTSGVEPLGLVEDKEFYIARIINNSGVVTVTDKRTEFLTFNVEGVSDKLSKSNNLSDLQDAAVARANLGVMTAIDVQNSYFNDTNWMSMTKGSKISATEFTLKIRRRGNNCIVQGRFTIGGTSLVDNDIIASIPYSSLRNSVSNYQYQNNSAVYFSAGESSLASHDANRGFIGVVPQKIVYETSLNIVVQKSSGDNQNVHLSINFSFFLD